MATLGRQGLVFLILPLSCFWLLGFSTAKLVQEEVDALQEIVTTLGSTYWKFDAVSCEIEMVGLTTVPPTGSDKDLVCECHNGSETDCHVVRMYSSQALDVQKRLKGYNLPGVLPPQLVKLPHLREIDLVYNYINGSIPREWAAMPLTNISLMVNRLSGEIPKELGNITSLRYLSLEANQFSGNIPTELGDLVNLDTLMLSSNQFTGNLPTSLARLKNLTDFRINDNNFNGTIPGFIQNWRKLERLEMHASGLEGPIPSNISQLDKLIQLRISDIGGPHQKFPQLNNATSLLRLVLRSCNLVGELPAYLWTLDELEMLDVSFNNLVGEIPSTITAEKLRFIFLTGNLLSGDIPDSILMSGVSVDLAYNNFTHQDPTQHACRDNMNMNLNLYQSSSTLNNSRPDLPCMKTFSCPRYSNCLHINSGGKDISVKENKTTYLYKGDGDVEGGTAAYFLNTENFWGFTSTGDFMDDNNFQNARYTASLQSSNLLELYSTARISPISLSYFHYCLENGKYTVTLHFAEIQFTNDKSYNSLGKRIFDIYIQERLVWKNFNIQDEVHSAQTPFLLPIRDVNVTNNMLEVRLYFAGRGTTRIPARGVYGPIISALSVVSDLKACSTKKENKTIYVVVGIIGASCVILMLLGILWWKGCFPNKRAKGKENDPDLPTGTFSLRQINAATNEFDPANKIGEGGFGPVYKGILSDGTVIAVKQLSDTSKQGNREFLNEIGMISCLKHPNLVKLHGFCVEGDQLLLVYEFMENNSLAGALFGDSHKLDWPTRHRICMGIARGLAFLHEESRLKIVHRDIKATNVLLDKNLNPKISDFGLARLHEEEKSHISTRIAGTIGYMAPEYALWGYLTYKVDVYSFGVVVLEIVSGKNNNSYMPINNCVCLLDWACNLQQSGSLLDIVDETLKPRINEEEAETMIKIALLCTNASPALRPTMSEVVSMLEGKTAIPVLVPAASTYAEDLRFKAMRDLKREGHDQSTSRSQTRSSTGVHTFPSSSSSTSSALDHDMYEINPISDFIRPKRSDAANSD